MKLLVFGWLFNKSPKQRKGLKFSSIHALLVSLKRSYRFLAKKDKHSLAQLSNTYVWADFETYLTTKVSKKSSLIKTFGALNAAIDYSSWHKLNLGLEPIKSTEVSDRLESTETQQTLVIPERLCNAIYGKAIELVEGAYPHRQLIADIEKSLQENYISAKHRVDEKVKAGTVFFIHEP